MWTVLFFCGMQLSNDFIPFCLLLDSWFWFLGSLHQMGRGWHAGWLWCPDRFRFFEPWTRLGPPRSSFLLYSTLDDLHSPTGVCDVLPLTIYASDLGRHWHNTAFCQCRLSCYVFARSNVFSQAALPWIWLWVLGPRTARPIREPHAIFCRRYVAPSFRACSHTGIPLELVFLRASSSFQKMHAQQ